MVHRHIMEDGNVQCCIVGDLPASIGDGVQALLTTVADVLASKCFVDPTEGEPRRSRSPECAGRASPRLISDEYLT